MELHPAEHAALAAALAGPGVAIHRRDGFEGALALAPFKPRRGLVLVDPSYEVKAEYAAAAAFVRRLRREMAGGDRARLVSAAAGRAASRAAARGSRRCRWRSTRSASTRAPARGMTGSGLALVNAPHGAAAFGEPGAGRAGAREECRVGSENAGKTEHSLARRIYGVLTIGERKRPAEGDCRPGAKTLCIDRRAGHGLAFARRTQVPACG